MKKLFLTFFIFIVFIVSSCNKDKIDYRDPFCGTYNVMYIIESWSGGFDSTGTPVYNHNVDTAYSNLFVTKLIGHNNEKIILKFEDTTLNTTFMSKYSNPKINTNGNFIYESSGFNPHLRSFFGEIKSNKITFVYDFQEKTYGYSYSYVGAKIN